MSMLSCEGDNGIEGTFRGMGHDVTSVRKLEFRFSHFVGSWIKIVDTSFISFHKKPFVAILYYSGLDDVLIGNNKTKTTIT